MRREVTRRLHTMLTQLGATQFTAEDTLSSARNANTAFPPIMATYVFMKHSVSDCVMRIIYARDIRLIEHHWTSRDGGAVDRDRPSRLQAEEAVRTLICWAGDDPTREGLLDTT
jgi:hypothetical protein